MEALADAASASRRSVSTKSPMSRNPSLSGHSTAQTQQACASPTYTARSLGASTAHIAVALVPRTQTDEDRLPDALHKLVQEDPSVVVDYDAVDPRLGSLGDFVEFVRTARDRGLRVIADLVVNHTSQEHPWFQSARADPKSPWRDWYVWRDEIPHDGPEGLVFPDVEDSNWEWDEKAGQYYLHRFYKHQPDLNIANPKVREEIRIEVAPLESSTMLVAWCSAK